MPESNTSKADQPPITNSMVGSHHLNNDNSSNNNNNHNHNYNNHPEHHHEGPAAVRLVSSSGAGSGAPNLHHGHQHHQQMMTPQMFQHHPSNYLPLYPSKPPMPGQYNGVMMDSAYEKETVCIYVPNSVVGAIIGKSGSAIKEMISNSGASIKVATAAPLVEGAPKEAESNSTPTPQNHTEASPNDKATTEEDKSQPESEQESQADVARHKKTRHIQNCANNNIRKVTIIGTPDSQWSAQYMIYRKVALENAGNDANLTAEIQVPSHLAGRIIGKGGATIKRLQKQTRTVIRLTDCRPLESSDQEKEQQQQQQQHQGDSRVQITGDFNGSQLAQRHIRALIRETLFPTKSRSGYFPDLNMPMNAMSHSPYLFNNIPLPYMHGPNAQYPISSSIVNSHANHGPQSMPRNMSGHHPNHQVSGAQMYADASNYLPLYPNKVQTSGYNGVMMEGVQEKETVCIYVPNSMVGAIIGKSGSAIKEMISNSGASIKVATAAPLVEGAPKEAESNSTPTPQNHTEARPDEKSTTEEEEEEDKSQPESEQESQTDAPKTPPKTKHPQNFIGTSNNIRKVTIVGTPDSQWSAQYMIYRKVALENMGGDVSLTAEILVPSHLAGRIIGKSGATIKRLQRQTRTVIRLTDCKPPVLPENDNKSENKSGTVDSKVERENGSEKELKQQQPPVDSCVQITGDFNGSQLAQRQIRSLIKQSVPLKIEVRLFSKS